MAAYLKGLPAADVGQIMGFAPATIEQGIFAADVKNGDAVSYTGGKFVKATAAADVYGIAVNVAPARAQSAENLVGGVLVQGYVAVANASGTPVRGAKVKLNTSGGFDAAAGTDLADVQWAADGATDDGVALLRIFK